MVDSFDLAYGEPLCEPSHMPHLAAPELRWAVLAVLAVLARSICGTSIHRNSKAPQELSCSAPGLWFTLGVES